MSINDKTENNINRTEYSTLYKEDEENNYRKNNSNNSNNIYLKTVNNFYKKPKIRIIKNKNKTPSKLYKIRYRYPSLRRSLREKKNNIFNPSYSLLENEQNYKDSLFLEVIREQKNKQLINKKLKELYNDYNSLEYENLTNFYIIQNLLELHDNDDDDNNKNNIKNQYEVNTKIYVLKKQINLYNSTIKKNEIKLEELKNKTKQKQYTELINLLSNKEKDINVINQKIHELNYILSEKNETINYYNLKKKKYNNDIIKLGKKIK